MIEIILGLGVGLLSVYYVMAKAGLLGLLFNLEAFILVFGGTVGSTIITYPLRILINALRAVLVTLFGVKRYRPQNVIRTIVNLAERVRTEGIFGIQNQLNTMDKFLRDGLQMIIDGIDPEVIRENLEKEIVFTRKRHEQIISVFRNMGTYAPIFGLLGTLLGVVQVLKNITDVKSLGTSMALAVTTTLYGIFFANFIFLPLAGKLESSSEEELLIKEVMIEGILSIQKGDIPLIVSKKLEAFFSQKHRKK
jgi:chemotaxis protein MotA